jgi:hypothetical protein
MSTDTPEQQPVNPPSPADASATAVPEAAAPAPPPVFSAPPSINPAVFSVAAARPRGRVTLTSILLAAAAVVAVAGIAFAVGRVTAPSVTANADGFGRAFNGGAGNGAFRGGTGTLPGANGANGGGFFGGANRGIELRGTVTSVDGDIVTIQLDNGRTVQVQTSSSTTYHTQVSGSSSDVSNGKSVIVQIGGANGLRGLLGQGGTGTGSVTVPATDVTVTGS